MLTDYESIIDVLRRRNIRHREDWDRNSLVNEIKIIKWIAIFNGDEEIRFLFDYNGKLEGISPLTHTENGGIIHG